ncbi:CLUMA_CG014079, isoform A [Clunio marinus]|uniref:CLUMA_CG014079, isoform A n=1 Tax=Clunio marinus TaxID=568069 RepID=A0A1J1IMQ4_9DIPT|nr:CLUMA_CG014079, isoform A [Clunio marinus]
MQSIDNRHEIISCRNDSSSNHSQVDAQFYLILNMKQKKKINVTSIHEIHMFMTNKEINYEL